MSRLPNLENQGTNQEFLRKIRESGEMPIAAFLRFLIDFGNRVRELGIVDLTSECEVEG